MQTAAADYHMHSSVSPDAYNSMEEMCAAAKSRGLDEIAVTDHYEFYKPKLTHHPFQGDYLGNYFERLESCRAKFDGKLRIRAGIEMGQSFLDLKTEQEILKQYPYDYVIGSMHKINNKDLGDMDYNHVDIDALCRKNLESLYELADKSDFDCMGHVDLIKRYAAFFDKNIDLMKYEPSLTQIFQRLIQRGKGIEINTSGLRQPAKEALPSPQILKLYRSLGGEILTIGSDAHCTADVAKGLDTALCMARQAGFTQIALFEKRQPHFISIV